MLKDGFTEEELATAKQGYKQARQISRAQDANFREARVTTSTSIAR